MARVIEKATDSWTGPSVVVTYTPDDGDAVKRALVDLVRLTVTASPFVSEDAGGYSYQRSEGDPARTIEASRAAIVRSLQPHRGPGSARLRSGAFSERVGEVASA